MNRLLMVEAQRIGVPLRDVDTSLRETDPDAGADARTQAGSRSSDWMPSGETVWQYKSGDPPTPAAIKGEAKKQAVQDCLKGGGTYVMVIQSELSDRMRRNRLEALRGAVKATRGARRGSCVLLSGEKIAEWASQHPVMLYEFRRTFAGLWPAADWLAKQQEHKGAFRADSARQAFIATVRRQFADDDGSVHLRLEGPPGVGKTRLALETFREPAEGALYSQQPPQDLSFFNWMADRDRPVSGILVVDECDRRTAGRLEREANMSERRLRLLTVGPPPPESAPDLTAEPSLFLLTPLDEEAIIQVISAAAPELPENQVQWIARISRGYVRLARLIATQVAAGRLSVDELTSAADIQELLRELIPDQELREVLQGVALLTRVGWEGDLAPEGQALANFLGLSWTAARRTVRRAESSGLVARQGRYRYVTPEILAIWLAADVWRSRGEDVLSLLGTLPTPESRDGLIGRLSSLGGVGEAAAAVESLLGRKGPFKSLIALSSEPSGRVISHLARGNPAAAAEALERTVGKATVAQLRDFTDGRRQVVWTLEGLAWRHETFLAAARLLLRLAEAENEPYGNNATGVWNGLFLTYLAGTEVPALERYPVIGEALHSRSTARKLLATSAIASALTIQEIGLGIGDDTGGFVPRERWRPRTWGEDHGCRKAALSLLDEVLRSRVGVVRQAGLAILYQSSRGLTRIGLADDVIGRLAHIEGKDVESRYGAWEAARSMLKYESNSLSDEQKQRISSVAEHLFGQSLVDRVRRYVGRPSHVDRSPGEQQAAPEDLLAGELLRNPGDLRAVLPWLFSGKADNAWFFGRQLGRRDESLEWLMALVAAANEGTDARALSGYLQGHADTSGENWRDDILDEWASDKRLANIVFDATYRGTATDRSIPRLLSLVDRGWVATDLLGWLSLGEWPGSMRPQVMGEVLNRLDADGSASSIESALSMADRWLEQHRGPLPAAASAAIWRTLETIPSGQPGQMLDFYWSEVAGKLLTTEPVRVVKAVLSGAEAQAVGAHDQRLNAIIPALERDPVAVWDQIGSAMLRSAHVAFTLSFWSTFEVHLPDNVDAKILLTWAKAHGRRGGEVVASLVKPRDRMTSLISGLLSTYGPASSVANVLAANFESGFWTGSQAIREEGQLSIAREWTRSDDTAVRAWAERIEVSLLERIPQMRLLEEERLGSSG